MRPKTLSLKFFLSPQALNHVRISSAILIVESRTANDQKSGEPSLSKLYRQAFIKNSSILRLN